MTFVVTIIDPEDGSTQHVRSFEDFESANEHALECEEMAVTLIASIEEVGKPSWWEHIDLFIEEVQS